MCNLAENFIKDVVFIEEFIVKFSGFSLAQEFIWKLSRYKGAKSNKRWVCPVLLKNFSRNTNEKNEDNNSKIVNWNLIYKTCKNKLIEIRFSDICPANVSESKCNFIVQKGKIWNDIYWYTVFYYPANEMCRECRHFVGQLTILIDAHKNISIANSNCGYISPVIPFFTKLTHCCRYLKL